MAKSKWRANFPDKAEKLAEDGMIDIQMAQALGISEATFYDYQDKHPEFSEAIKRGKAKTDKRVIESLLKRAVGFTAEETTTDMKVDPDGQAGQVTSIRKTTREIPPDTGAAAFWLKNRQPDAWRESRHIEGNIGGGVYILGDESVKKDLDDITEFGTRRPSGSDNSVQEESEGT